MIKKITMVLFSRLQYTLLRGGLENCKIIVSNEVASDQQTQKVIERTEKRVVQCRGKVSGVSE